MKKIIPPHLFLLCNAGMVATHLIAAHDAWPLYPFNFIGIIPLMFGLNLARRGKQYILESQTEIHTFKTPKKMLSDGIFSWSRNPIYLGFAISLCGTGLLLNCLSAVIFVPAFILISNYLYIPFEEKMMKEQFGEQYQTYRMRVRRWF